MLTVVLTVVLQDQQPVLSRVLHRRRDHLFPVASLCLSLLLAGSAAQAAIDNFLAVDDGDSIWMPVFGGPPDELPLEATPEPAAEGSPAGVAQQHSLGLSAAGAGTNATPHQPAPGAAAAAAGAPGPPSGSQAGPGAQQEAAAAQAATPAEQARDQGTLEMATSDAETEDYGASPATDACPEAGTSNAAAVAAGGNGAGPTGKEGAQLTSGAAKYDPYEFCGTEVQQDTVPDAIRPAPAAASHQVGHWGVFGGMMLLAGHHSESQWQQRSRPVVRGGLCLVLIQASAAQPAWS